MMHWKKTFSWTAILGALAAMATPSSQADPAITGISSGNIANGQDLTINGSAFGTKATAAPFLYDNVESGSFNPAWQTSNQLTPNSDNNRTPFSQYNAHVNFTSNVSGGYFTSPDSTTSSHWFASYWIKLGSDWDYGTTDFSGNDRFLSNIKLFRMWNPSSSINENFLFSYAGWADSFIFNMENVAGPSASPNGYYIGNARELLTPGTWHQFQFEFAENSAVGASDGQFRVWLDGRMLKERTDLLTREDFPDLKRIGVLGAHAPWGPNTGESDQAPNDYYMDDMYVDTTWSRVEIGDKPLYSQTTHRELQSAKVWSNGSVTVNVNQGSFAPGSTVYLFLTDAAGNVNENGFAVTLIPEPSTTALWTLAGVLLLWKFRTQFRKRRGAGLLPK